MIRAFLPGMLARGRVDHQHVFGRGAEEGAGQPRGLFASKAAVVGLTRAVAADHVTQGIRCNAICPGTVDSPSLHDRLRATGDYDGALKAFIARQAMGRLGGPRKSRPSCAILPRTKRPLPGTEHVIDGGWTT